MRRVRPVAADRESARVTEGTGRGFPCLPENACGFSASRIGPRTDVGQRRIVTIQAMQRVPVALLVAGLASGVILLLAACGGQDEESGLIRAGPGMMGYASQDGVPVRDLGAARAQADRFAAPLGLHVGEVMQFSNGFYAELLDPDERGATEVLVDPGSGAVWIEYGPAMMWNTRYGMMSGSAMTGGGMMMGSSGMMGSAGMMGGWGMMSNAFGWGMGGAGFRGDPTWTPYGGTAGRQRISPRKAESIAARWLAANAPELTGGEAEPFPGYYTAHTLRGGEVEGMLSVHAYTGAVWYHWWHGRFVAMVE